MSELTDILLDILQVASTYFALTVKETERVTSTIESNVAIMLERVSYIDNNLILKLKQIDEKTEQDLRIGTLNGGASRMNVISSSNITNINKILVDVTTLSGYDVLTSDGDQIMNTSFNLVGDLLIDGELNVRGALHKLTDITVNFGVTKVKLNLINGEGGIRFGSSATLLYNEQQQAFTSSSCIKVKTLHLKSGVTEMSLSNSMITWSEHENIHIQNNILQNMSVTDAEQLLVNENNQLGFIDFSSYSNILQSTDLADSTKVLQTYIDTTLINISHTNAIGLLNIENDKLSIYQDDYSVSINEFTQLYNFSTSLEGLVSTLNANITLVSNFNTIELENLISIQENELITSNYSIPHDFISSFPQTLDLYNHVGELSDISFNELVGYNDSRGNLLQYISNIDLHYSNLLNESMLLNDTLTTLDTFSSHVSSLVPQSFNDSITYTQHSQDLIQYKDNIDSLSLHNYANYINDIVSSEVISNPTSLFNNMHIVGDLVVENLSLRYIDIKNSDSIITHLKTITLVEEAIEDTYLTTSTDPGIIIKGDTDKSILLKQITSSNSILSTKSGPHFEFSEELVSNDFEIFNALNLTLTTMNDIISTKYGELASIQAYLTDVNNVVTTLNSDRILLNTALLTSTQVIEDNISRANLENITLVTIGGELDIINSTLTSYETTLPNLTFDISLLDSINTSLSVSIPNTIDTHIIDNTISLNTRLGSTISTHFGSVTSNDTITIDGDLIYIGLTDTNCPDISHVSISENGLIDMTSLINIQTASALATNVNSTIDIQNQDLVQINSILTSLTPVLHTLGTANAINDTVTSLSTYSTNINNIITTSFDKLTYANELLSSLPQSYNQYVLDINNTFEQGYDLLTLLNTSMSSLPVLPSNIDKYISINDLFTLTNATATNVQDSIDRDVIFMTNVNGSISTLNQTLILENEYLININDSLHLLDVDGANTSIIGLVEINSLSLLLNDYATNINQVINNYNDHTSNISLLINDTNTHNDTFNSLNQYQLNVNQTHVDLLSYVTSLDTSNLILTDIKDQTITGNVSFANLTIDNLLTSSSVRTSTFTGDLITLNNGLTQDDTNANGGGIDFMRYNNVTESFDVPDNFTLQGDMLLLASPYSLSSVNYNISKQSNYIDSINLSLQSSLLDLNTINSSLLDTSILVLSNALSNSVNESLSLINATTFDYSIGSTVNNTLTSQILNYDSQISLFTSYNTTKSTLSQTLNNSLLTTGSTVDTINADLVSITGNGVTELDVGSSLPVSTLGEMYVNTTDEKVYIGTSSGWTDITSSGGISSHSLKLATSLWTNAAILAGTGAGSSIDGNGGLVLGTARGNVGLVDVPFRTRSSYEFELTSVSSTVYPDIILLNKQIFEGLSNATSWPILQSASVGYGMNVIIPNSNTPSTVFYNNSSLTSYKPGVYTSSPSLPQGTIIQVSFVYNIIEYVVIHPTLGVIYRNNLEFESYVNLLNMPSYNLRLGISVDSTSSVWKLSNIVHDYYGESCLSLTNIQTIGFHTPLNLISGLWLTSNTASITSNTISNTTPGTFSSLGLVTNGTQHTPGFVMDGSYASFRLTSNPNSDLPVFGLIDVHELDESNVSDIFATSLSIQNGVLIKGVLGTGVNYMYNGGTWTNNTAVTTSSPTSEVGDIVQIGIRGSSIEMMCINELGVIKFHTSLEALYGFGNLRNKKFCISVKGTDTWEHIIDESFHGNLICDEIYSLNGNSVDATADYDFGCTMTDIGTISRDTFTDTPVLTPVSDIVHMGPRTQTLTVSGDGVNTNTTSSNYHAGAVIDSPICNGQYFEIELRNTWSTSSTTASTIIIGHASCRSIIRGITDTTNWAGSVSSYGGFFTMLGASKWVTSRGGTTGALNGLTPTVFTDTTMNVGSYIQIGYNSGTLEVIYVQDNGTVLVRDIFNIDKSQYLHAQMPFVGASVSNMQLRIPPVKHTYKGTFTNMRYMFEDNDDYSPIYRPMPTTVSNYSGFLSTSWIDGYMDEYLVCGEQYTGSTRLNNMALYPRALTCGQYCEFEIRTMDGTPWKIEDSALHFSLLNVASLKTGSGADWGDSTIYNNNGKRVRVISNNDINTKENIANEVTRTGTSSFLKTGGVNQVIQSGGRVQFMFCINIFECVVIDVDGRVVHAISHTDDIGLPWGIQTTSFKDYIYGLSSTDPCLIIKSPDQPMKYRGTQGSVSHIHNSLKQMCYVKSNNIKTNDHSTLVVDEKINYVTRDNKISLSTGLIGNLPAHNSKYYGTIYTTLDGDVYMCGSTSWLKIY